MKNESYPANSWLFTIVNVEQNVCSSGKLSNSAHASCLPAGQIGLHQYLISSADGSTPRLSPQGKTNLIQAITNGNLSTYYRETGLHELDNFHFDYTSEAQLWIHWTDYGRWYEEYININMHDNQLYMEINTATDLWLMPLNDDVQGIPQLSGTIMVTKPVWT